MKRLGLSDKKAQGLSTNAIILIILGVAILVILIIGFTIGWQTLVPFLKSDNVDTIIKACETSCSTQSVFSYCSQEKDLNTGLDSPQNIKATCQVLDKLDEFNSYGLQACAIDCTAVACSDIKVTVDGNERVAVAGAVACDTAISKDVSNLANDANGVDSFCCLPN